MGHQPALLGRKGGGEPDIPVGDFEHAATLRLDDAQQGRVVVNFRNT
jgi:hypothetical protein